MRVNLEQVYVPLDGAGVAAAGLGQRGAPEPLSRPAGAQEGDNLEQACGPCERVILLGRGHEGEFHTSPANPSHGRRLGQGAEPAG